MKSKQQIWVVWNSNQWGEFTSPAMITTSITKVKRFIIKQIKSEDCLYNPYNKSKTEQIKLFKEDFKKKERKIINSNLTWFQYEYYYDGEEI